MSGEGITLNASSTLPWQIPLTSSLSLPEMSSEQDQIVIYGKPAVATDNRNVPMLDPGEYTVGWISALPIELKAARAMLDDVHGQLESQPTHDNNNYILGQIGKHNVVMACLTEYGPEHAALASKSMQSTFPNLRFGLMVGVGGGVPGPTYDIRLGDIVVSMPHGKGGGVVHHDHGRFETNGLDRTGTLNKPPDLLRAAVRTLQSETGLGKKVFCHFKNAFEINEDLDDDEDWRYPGVTEDVLFSPKYTHIGKNPTCCECGNAAKDGDQIRRTSRKSEWPKVHFGNIASGSSVMKNAEKRDEIAERDDVICFEMEAAGLMDSWPCLVIRGISDYSDSHKNWNWQPYAAAIASAFSKLLLSKVSPQQVHLMDQIKLGEINELLRRVHNYQRNEEDENILTWLTTVDYRKKHHDCLTQRYQGTCKWFLKSQKYETWRCANNQTLFCQGMPGAGKTILTATVIDDLIHHYGSDPTVTIAFVYCEFGRESEQTAIDLLVSLLKQICQNCPVLPDRIRALYHRNKSHRTRLSLEEISEILLSTLSSYSRGFIIVDALDECGTAYNYLPKFISELFNLQTKCGVNIFATSRFGKTISSYFEGKPSLEIQADEHDLAAYFEGRINDLRPFVIRNPKLRNEIKAAILDSVGGMFLLAQLYHDLLTDKHTPNEIRNTIRGFKKMDQQFTVTERTEVLTTIYNQVMKRINHQEDGFRGLAIRVLLWISCARRPLNPLELQQALSTKIGQSEIDQGDFYDIDDITSFCAGLVTFHKEDNVIRLVHHTAQEYFDKTRRNWFPDADLYMQNICISYLSFKAFASGECRTNQDLERRRESHSFYDYAGKNWGHHARQSAPTSIPGVLKFLKDEQNLKASAQVLTLVDELPCSRGIKMQWTDVTELHPSHISGLHLAAYFGLEEAVKSLLEFMNADLMDWYGRTPLSYAAENGFLAVSELLISTNALDINSSASALRQDHCDLTPLSYASMKGHTAIVELLLGQDSILPNKTSTHGSHCSGRTALSFAAEGGHNDVVKKLLTHRDLDPNLRATGYIVRGKTALSIAAGIGHAGVVNLLLADSRLKPESKISPGGQRCPQTPPLPTDKMSNYNYRKISSIVSNPKSSSGIYHSPRDLPLSDGGITDNSDAIFERAKYSLTLLRKDLAQALITYVNEADLDPEVNPANLLNSRTALSFAAESGHIEVVKLLLDSPVVDPDSSPSGNPLPSRRPLLFTAEDRELEGFIIWASRWRGLGRHPLRGDSGGLVSAYSSMSKANQLSVITETGLLCRARYSEHSIETTYGRTPLSYAAEAGKIEIVQMLLARPNVDPNSKASGNHVRGRTPLSFASELGHTHIIQLLISSDGIDINSTDHCGRTALMWAANYGQEEAVKLLLQKDDIKVNWKDIDGITASRMAARCGYRNIVKLISDWLQSRNGLKIC